MYQSNQQLLQTVTSVLASPALPENEVFSHKCNLAADPTGAGPSLHPHLVLTLAHTLEVCVRSLGRVLGVLLNCSLLTTREATAPNFNLGFE